MSRPSITTPSAPRVKSCFREETTRSPNRATASWCTDRSVREVYRIVDSENGNDDAETGVLNGNGVGFEPFTDANNNGTRDSGEPFEDLNGNGIWDDNLAESWVRATPVQATPSINSAYPLEWRFDYSRQRQCADRCG